MNIEPGLLNQETEDPDEGYGSARPDFLHPDFFNPQVSVDASWFDVKHPYHTLHQHIKQEGISKLSAEDLHVYVRRIHDMLDVIERQSKWFIPYKVSLPTAYLMGSHSWLVQQGLLKRLWQDHWSCLPSPKHAQRRNTRGLRAQKVMLVWMDVFIQQLNTGHFLDVLKDEYLNACSEFWLQTLSQSHLSWIKRLTQLMDTHFLEAWNQTPGMIQYRLIHLSGDEHFQILSYLNQYPKGQAVIDQIRLRLNFSVMSPDNLLNTQTHLARLDAEREQQRLYQCVEHNGNMESILKSKRRL